MLKWLERHSPSNFLASDEALSKTESVLRLLPCEEELEELEEKLSGDDTLVQSGLKMSDISGDIPFLSSRLQLNLEAPFRSLFFIEKLESVQFSSEVEESLRARPKTSESSSSISPKHLATNFGELNFYFS